MAENGWSCDYLMTDCLYELVTYRDGVTDWLWTLDNRDWLIIHTSLSLPIPPFSLVHSPSLLILLLLIFVHLSCSSSSLFLILSFSLFVLRSPFHSSSSPFSSYLFFFFILRLFVPLLTFSSSSGFLLFLWVPHLPWSTSFSSPLACIARLPARHTKDSWTSLRSRLETLQN